MAPQRDPISIVSRGTIFIFGNCNGQFVHQTKILFLLSLVALEVLLMIGKMANLMGVPNIALLCGIHMETGTVQIINT